MSIILTLKKIKRDFIKKSVFKELSSNLGNSILLSKDLKSNSVKECFKERICITNDDIIIERIEKAYNKAKSIQKSYSTAFQVGNEWLPIYERYMIDIMTTLKSSNVSDIKKIYENFMREDCSVGLHGMPVNMKTTYFTGEISKLDGNIYLHDAIYRYKHWKELTNNKYSPEDLFMPDYGNSYGYYIDNVFIRTGAEYFQYYATRISSLIRNEIDRKVVVELGGGYGGLGYFLTKQIPDLTYVDFDLPENMALTAYYLMNSFPEKRVLLYGEGELNAKNLEEYDIVIMPNFELPKFPSNRANLAFNSYSLAEMSTETIQTYIPELKRASKEHIYHVNHNEISHSLKADEFGIDDDNYKLIYKKPALWNIGRDAKMDEYEYLYTKSRIS
jgi:putative sugar O-methyltransferase